MSPLYESTRCELALLRPFAIFILQFSICIYPHTPAFTASSRHELFPFDLRVLRARGRNHQPFAPHLRKRSDGQAQLTPPLLLSSLASPKVPLAVLAKTRPTSQPSRCIPPPPRTPAPMNQWPP